MLGHVALCIHDTHPIIHSTSEISDAEELQLAESKGEINNSPTDRDNDYVHKEQEKGDWFPTAVDKEQHCAHQLQVIDDETGYDTQTTDCKSPPSGPEGRRSSAESGYFAPTNQAEPDDTASQTRRAETRHQLPANKAQIRVSISSRPTVMSTTDESANTTDNETKHKI